MKQPCHVELTFIAVGDLLSIAGAVALITSLIGGESARYILGSALVMAFGIGLIAVPYLPRSRQ